MVLRPNASLYAMMVDEAGRRDSKWGSNAWVAVPGNKGLSSDGFFRNDQRFLGEFFLARHNATLPAVWLDPYVYHANPLMCAGFPADKLPAPGLANFSWEHTVKLTHFGCVSKPWKGADTADVPPCLERVVALWRRHLAGAVEDALKHPQCNKPLVTELLAQAIQPRIVS